MTTVQLVSIGILLVTLAVATLRGVHIGALALAVALGVGLTLGAESTKEVMAGFPVDLMLLLLGITYLVAIARVNGTLDRLVDWAVRRTGTRKVLLPWVMFALALAIAALGNPLAAMIVIPIAMLLAEQNGRDPVVMGLGAINGSLAGCFAPTSLYGVLSVNIGEMAGVELNPFAQFAFVLAVVVGLQVGAQFLFRRHRTIEPGDAPASTPPVPGPTDASTHSIGGSGSAPVAVQTRLDTAPGTVSASTAVQRVTMGALSLLIVVVVLAPALGYAVNIGAVALSLGIVIALLFPKETRPAIGDIDWSTILLVGGVVTYVGILQRMGAVDSLGNVAVSIPSALVAAFAVCVIAAVISAFASTTALFPALIPLALPMVATGNLSAAGLIIAIGASATLVDASPFSTSGAIMVASSPPEEHTRVFKMLLRWGLSMAVIGPLVTCGLLLVPGYF
ncbi:MULTISPECIES: SLC13 family permease [unclassified Mycolicibacterium]|uniref:SLC13 family permease n=1 Tax=unclassified Mycolicibacterium TaxID=2636767 RepID=UPI001F4BF81E|nr:SLC13 family permease [Mycolicibacterium sp. YH-1]UNB50267.1 C4-dicarboxylate ABC transporter [Mycolicibacterium sp. YH-1]